MIEFTINGLPAAAEPGTTVAAALLNNDAMAFRSSATGSMRAPLCGMGICFECRVTINGSPHERSCLIPIEAGMEVTTDA